MPVTKAANLAVFLRHTATQEMGAAGSCNEAELRHGLVACLGKRGGLSGDLLVMTKAETVVLSCSPERNSWKITFAMIPYSSALLQPARRRWLRFGMRVYPAPGRLVPLHGLVRSQELGGTAAIHPCFDLWQKQGIQNHRACF